MQLFHFHAGKVMPVELAADKSKTVHKVEPKPDEPKLEAIKRLRLEIGFPSTPVNAEQRSVKIGSASEEPVTVDFSPDVSAAEFLVPNNESTRIEFITKYHKKNGEEGEPRIEVISAEFFAQQKQNVIAEPSPLSLNMLGEVETYISSEPLIVEAMGAPTKHSKLKEPEEPPKKTEPASKAEEEAKKKKEEEEVKKKKEEEAKKATPKK